MSMGKVGTGFSMSLDGFVAGPNDDESQVFAWMSMGSTDVIMSTGDHDIDLKLSEQSAEMLADAAQSIGALVSGRRLFNITGAWGGKHPLNIPVVVVTHHVPEEWANKPGSPFTFVTDGVASAIEQAQQIAGDKMVVIASTTILQQAIRLGLLDEIHIDLVPVLLGAGVSMFDHLGIDPIDLECTSMIKAPGVIHLDFRVIK
jgi:dihydrofolate reductase